MVIEILPACFNCRHLQGLLLNLVYEAQQIPNQIPLWGNSSVSCPRNSNSLLDNCSIGPRPGKGSFFLLQSLILLNYIVKLLPHIAPLVIFLHREKKQATPFAGLLPVMANLRLFPRIVIGFVRLTLVLHYQHAAIGQFAHEIRVEVIVSGRQPEGVIRSLVGH